MFTPHFPFSTAFLKRIFFFFLIVLECLNVLARQCILVAGLFRAPLYRACGTLGTAVGEQWEARRHWEWDLILNSFIKSFKVMWWELVLKFFVFLVWQTL